MEELVAFEEVVALCGSSSSGSREVPLREDILVSRLAANLRWLSSLRHMK